MAFYEWKFIGIKRSLYVALSALQISHIIREIRQFQQAPYRIEHQSKVSLFYNHLFI